MNIMKLIEAEMTIMEGKELVFASSCPANTVLECCEEAQKRLAELIDNIKTNPKEYVRDNDATDGLAKRYNIEVKVVRLKDDYLKELG